MTRKARRQQRRDIQADYEQGMSKAELRDKYHISIQSVYRALMSDQAYDHMIAQAQVRNERASLRVPNDIEGIPARRRGPAWRASAQGRERTCRTA